MKMSFKRDGDDQSQLNLLKKRRVSDLLANDIPEDEAFLMSNGRYACTVCHHRPVLDTIAMLFVHRHGKKHLSYLKSYYAKKQDLVNEVRKRKQELYLANQRNNKVSLQEVEDVAPLLTKTRKATHHALLKAAPYKGYGRSPSNQECNTSSYSTILRNMERSRNSQQDDGNSLRTGLMTRTSQSEDSGSKDCSTSSQSKTFTPTPSCLDAKANATSGDVDIKSSLHAWDDTNITVSCNPKIQSIEEPLTVEEKRCPASFQLKPYIAKRQRNKMQHDHEQSSQLASTAYAKQDFNHTKELPTSKLDIAISKEPSMFEFNVSKNNAVNHTSWIPSDTNVKRADLIPKRDLRRLKGKDLKHTSSSKNSSNFTADSKKMDREKYLQMTSSGWKADWKGGWIRDQDVEFDSDEDVPAV